MALKWFNHHSYVGAFPVKSGVTLTEGDLVGLNTSGRLDFAVAAPTFIECLGVVVLQGIGRGGVADTISGDSGGTVKASVYSEALVDGLSLTTAQAQYLKLTNAGGGTGLNTTSVQATDGSLLQRLGVAVASDQCFFDVRQSIVKKWNIDPDGAAQLQQR